MDQRLVSVKGEKRAGGDEGEFLALRCGLAGSSSALFFSPARAPLVGADGESKRAPIFFVAPRWTPLKKGPQACQRVKEEPRLRPP